MNQLHLFPGNDVSMLRGNIERAVKKNIALIITDNSRVMLSFRRNKDHFALRLHRMFLSADPAVIDELARYVKNSSIKTPLIRQFINRNSHMLKKKPPRNITLVHQGKNANVSDLFNKINAEYFHGALSCSITWSTRRPARSAAKRTLGSYSEESDLIRINPILDSRKIPRYFLEYVIYHEMLHADMKDKSLSGRRTVHCAAFKKREQMFHHYSRATAWESQRWG